MRYHFIRDEIFPNAQLYIARTFLYIVHAWRHLKHLFSLHGSIKCILFVFDYYKYPNHKISHDQPKFAWVLYYGNQSESLAQQATASQLLLLFSERHFVYILPHCSQYPWQSRSVNVFIPEECLRCDSYIIHVHPLLQNYMATPLNFDSSIVIRL